MNESNYACCQGAYTVTRGQRSKYLNVICITGALTETYTRYKMVTSGDRYLHYVLSNQILLGSQANINFGNKKKNRVGKGLDV